MMIPEDHELYSADGRSFQIKMIDYIRRHFGKVLGEDAKLLDEPDGLDRLAKITKLNREIKKRAA